jgi:hypothetical protein
MDKIELRPEVQKFAEAMELLLRANEHKTSWKICQQNYLLRKMIGNADALEGALRRSDKAAILRRAVNVANFAMMIVDNAGGLDYEYGGDA